MRHVCVLALVSMLAASASSFAQDNGSIPVQRPPIPAARPLPRGSVVGHVYLADTHSPARGARIMLMPTAEFGIGDEATSSFNGDQQMAITALDGSFLLPHVATGQYVVLAFAAGYLSPMDGMEMETGKNSQADTKAMGKKLMENAPVVRVTGVEAARIDIDLQRGAVLSGRVLYSDGAPAAQLAVSVQKSGDAKPSSNPTMDVGAVMRALFLHQRLSTDDEGRFRIAGIAPGSYCLAVAQNFAAGTDIGEVMMSEINPMMAAQPGRLTIYSGNTLHRKDAKVYELKAGDVVDGIEITLPLNGLHTIHGSVAGKDGTPLNSGTIELADTSDSTITFRANVEVDGEFRFSGVPEGNYQLKASNGRILENPPAGNVPEDAIQYDPQFKPMRAFANTTVSVTVQTTDIDGLTVTLPETKLPDLPKQPQFPMPDQPGVPDQPAGPGPQ